MTRRVSDGTIERRVGVVIPLRSLETGKQRLGTVLSAADRRALVRSMAETVVRAAHELPVLVVHDDPAVADWAAGLGITAAAAPIPGLNAAVAFGRDRLERQGFSHVVVAHADLPRARDLRPVADFEGITLVPDRFCDGTNVLGLPAGVAFDFAYGPGSFELHRRFAETRGLAVRVLLDDDLAWDVDRPDDLAEPAVHRTDRS